jgi:hypothetical protein
MKKNAATDRGLDISSRDKSPYSEPLYSRQAT